LLGLIAGQKSCTWVRPLLVVFFNRLERSWCVEV
jgi:hypothetical protein